MTRGHQASCILVNIVSASNKWQIDDFGSSGSKCRNASQNRRPGFVASLVSLGDPGGPTKSPPAPREIFEEIVMIGSTPAILATSPQDR